MSPFKLPASKLLVLFSLLSSSPVTWAATQYISDELRVPLRNSPCNSCKIIHRGLRSGLALSVLEVQTEWTQVRTPAGLQGWVPSQYLSSKPVARDLLERYRVQAEELRGENTRLKKERSVLTNENAKLKTQLLELGKSNSNISEELSSIRNISADAINLHEQNRELLKLNKVLQTDLDVLTATKEQLEKNQFQRWFIYGGLLVFLGAILSAVLPHLKPRKKGYSEWR